MSQRELYGTIVHVRNTGDSHRIVELLTADEGKLSLIARGGRASKKRFAGALDLFVAIRANVVCRGSMWTLHAADVLNHRIRIRTDLHAFARANLLCDAAKSLTAAHVNAEEILAALDEGLDVLNSGNVAGGVDAYIRMLGAAGYLPDAHHCASCERSLHSGAIDVERGGILCARCARNPSLDADGLEVFRGAPCTDAHVAQMVESCALSMIEHQQGKPLQSRRILRAS